MKCSTWEELEKPFWILFEMSCLSSSDMTTIISSMPSYDRMINTSIHMMLAIVLYTFSVPSLFRDFHSHSSSSSSSFWSHYKHFRMHISFSVINFLINKCIYLNIPSVFDFIYECIIKYNLNEMQLILIKCYLHIIHILLDGNDYNYLLIDWNWEWEGMCHCHAIVNIRMHVW